MELPLPGDESTEIGRLACGAKSGGSFSRKQGDCSSRQEDPELTAGKDLSETKRRRGRMRGDGRGMRGARGMLNFLNEGRIRLFT